MVFVAGGLLLGAANSPEAPLYDYSIVSLLISPTSATLGALIVSRRPENVIGWIFLVLSIAGGLPMFSGQYATVALFSSGIVGYVAFFTLVVWLSPASPDVRLAFLGSPLEAYSAKLRDETDLNRLGDDLLAAVRETVQPVHASLWIRSK